MPEPVKRNPNPDLRPRRLAVPREIRAVFIQAAIAGFAGLITRGTYEGDRDLVADAIVGALLVSSHIVLDDLPLPYRSNVRGAAGTRIAGVRIVNWLLDAVVYGALAWKLWPRESGTSAGMER